MINNWLDYPIRVFRAVARTVIGRFFLCVLACAVGEWLHLFFAENIEYGIRSLTFPDFYDLQGTFILIPASGIVCGWGIPLLLLQLGGFNLVLRGKHILHYWFGLAYCQALLTTIFLAEISNGFKRWHLTSIAVTLLILGVTHGLLAWFMARRIKRRASYNDESEETKINKTVWEKVELGFVCGIFGICTISVIAWFLPFPIEGNWLLPWDPAPCACEYERGCHRFLRFENGKILEMSNVHIPPNWKGTYKRKGWGRYEIEIFDSDDPSFIVYSSCLRIATLGEWRYSRILRDLRSACREAVNNPSNDWVYVQDDVSYRVTGTPENRMFHNWRGEHTKELPEAKLDCLFRQSLQIYTASNEVPSSVLDVLDERGVDYTIHANQEWIEPDKNHVVHGWDVPDTLRTNPVWVAIDNRTLYGVVIMPPFWQKRFGGSHDKDLVYFTSNSFLSFEPLKGVVHSHRWHRNNWQKNLRLYVKDGILPEDVRQLFEPFDLEYTVLDDKVLYRGKKKDPYAKKGDAP